MLWIWDFMPERSECSQNHRGSSRTGVITFHMLHNWTTLKNTIKTVQWGFRERPVFLLDPVKAKFKPRACGTWKKKPTKNQTVYVPMQEFSLRSECILWTVRIVYNLQLCQEMYIYTVEYIYYNKMLKSCWKFEEIIRGFEVWSVGMFGSDPELTLV